MGEWLVPLTAIFFVFGAPVAAFVISRVLRHRERMELLRHGFVPPEFAEGQPGPWPPGSRMTAGAPWRRPRAGCLPEDDPQRALFKGIRIAFIGLALLIGLSFIGGTPGTRTFETGPWLLGGLIPLFVGIAQIVIAVLCGAQLPVRPAETAAPPSAGTPAGPAAPGVAPWPQPARTRFEELAKPAPPPDLR